MAFIYKRGNIWWIQFRQNGKTYRESLKTKNKKYAEKMCVDVGHDLLQENLPFLLVNKTKLADLGQLIIDDYDLMGRDVKAITTKVEKILTYFKKNASASSVNSASIRKFKLYMRKDGYANATINRHLAALRRMFSLAVEETPKLVNSAPKFKLLPENNVKTGFFDFEQFLKLRAAIEPYLKVFITVAYDYGIRRGALKKLTWDHVDRSVWFLRIPAEIMKTRQAIILPLSKELEEMFKAMWDHKEKNCINIPHVFLNKAGTGPVKYFRRDWNRACRDTGLGYGYIISTAYRKKWEEKLSQGPTLHDCRRSASRLCSQAGANQRQTMALMGHKTNAMYRRYNIVNEADLVRVVRQVEEFKKKEKKRIEKKNKKQNKDS